MDTGLFVQNVKMYSALKGISATAACRDSGAGKDLINQIESRGSITSVAKVQMLADYLGVTTSELLGETTKPATESGAVFSAEAAAVARAYDAAGAELQAAVRRVLNI